ncbi:MAG: hypothetical protein ABI760_05295 [Ferruginibacter sp.]
MIAKYLWIAGSLPFIILGTIHLLYTFFTNKFSSRNKTVDEAMKSSFPVLTKQTTMWKAWRGFNASHSSGAIYIGLINLFAAIQYIDVLQNPLFLSLNIVTVLFYLWLAKKYWFNTPFVCILIATCCFSAAVVLIISK